LAHFFGYMFLDACKRWNETHMILPPRSKPQKGQELKITIFPKYVGHLTKHYKAWVVNHKKRVAIEVLALDCAMRWENYDTTQVWHCLAILRRKAFQWSLYKVNESTAEASSGLSFAAPALQISPPAMHLAPYPYFPIHQALQAPLVWGGAPPFQHTVSQQELPRRKRAWTVHSKCNNLECTALGYTSNPCALIYEKPLSLDIENDFVFLCKDTTYEDNWLRNLKMTWVFK
jgi:hypothetical protein